MSARSRVVNHAKFLAVLLCVGACGERQAADSPGMDAGAPSMSSDTSIPTGSMSPPSDTAASPAPDPTPVRDPSKVVRDKSPESQPKP
jgi:hypothetical protein